MPTKIRDLAVKTGEYRDRDGNTKGRYENVGVMMRGDDGGEFLLIKRTFNPAGVPNPDNRDTVSVSCFKAERRDNPPPRQSSSQRQQYDERNPPPQGGGHGGAGDFDDAIPFAPEWRV